MGVFIYSNKKIDVSKSETIFQSRGHANIISESVVGTFVHANKILIDNTNYLDGLQLNNNENEGFILGIGTYFYKHLCGENALKAIYQDLDKILEDNLIYGHYAFVVQKDGKTYIFNDMSGTMRLFYMQEGEDITISSSMLAVVASIEHPVMDKMRLSAFICGYCANEIPFVEGVKDVNPLKYLMIDENGKARWIKRKEEVAKRIETLDEAIELCKSLFKMQMIQLKVIGDEKIAVEMTAGLDSRLNLSNLKTSGFNYEFVNYPLFGPDSEVANLIANGLETNVHVIKNIPCTKDFDNLFGEFDFGFNFFRHYPNQRWNIDSRFQFSGALGECLDIPSFYTGGDVSMVNNPKPSFLLPILTTTNYMNENYRDKYIQYIQDYMKERGFAPNKIMTEKEQAQFIQIIYGQMTGDYMFNSAANAHLYYYSIYNEYHFNHFIMDISFDAKSRRKLTLALINAIDPELGAYPFVSHRRIRRKSVNGTKELPMQYKSYNKVKQLLPKPVLDFIFARMGRRFDKTRLNNIDVKLYKNIIEVDLMIKYPNLYSGYLNRLFSVEVIRKKFGIEL